MSCLKYFVERVFYCEKTDTLVALSFVSVNSGCWVKEVLTPNGSWAHVDVWPTYEDGYNSIRFMQPIVICQEELA